MDKLVFSISSETRDGNTVTVFDYEHNGKKMTATFDPEKDNEVEFVSKLLAGIEGVSPKKEKPKEWKLARISTVKNRFQDAVKWATENLKGDQLVEFGVGMYEEPKDGDIGIVVKIAPASSLKDAAEIAAVRIRFERKHYIALFPLDDLEAL